MCVSVCVCAYTVRLRGCIRILVWPHTGFISDSVDRLTGLDIGLLQIVESSMFLGSPET